jgi:peptidoglycan/xylan/chitin deacetylase (PgdA/CDA1 family)
MSRAKEHCSSATGGMVNVLITIDTEVWPDAPGWPHAPLPPGYDARRDVERYLRGGSGAQARGVPYQLAVFARTGLKATYFVDPMFSFALGIEPLRELVAKIAGSGQEIGLHLHPEWLTDRHCADLPPFRGPLLHAYSDGDQRLLIRAALERLAEAGSPPVTAFRAGSWGANLATLGALRDNGIRCDSSLNARFDASFPDLEPATRAGATQPFLLGSIAEYPVTNFCDRPPSGRRPLHVCAASLAEFRMVLDHAFVHRWEAVVIVLHSFEFVRVDRTRTSGAVAAQRLLARRFEGLCAYLDRNRSRFATCHFSDLAQRPADRPVHPPLPRSSRSRTAMRHLEQLASRVY